MNSRATNEPMRKLKKKIPSESDPFNADNLKGFQCDKLNLKHYKQV